MTLPARLTLACVSVFLACAAAQAQQLYRWTDEKGRVHITDTPPPASAKSAAHVENAIPTKVSAQNGATSFIRCERPRLPHAQ